MDHQNQSQMIKTLRCAGLLCSILSSVPAAADTIVTFDAGAEGWSGVGAVEGAGGNPGANFHMVNPDTFGMTLTNSTNAEFVFDYTTVSSATLNVDVQVDDISFFGSPVPRPWLVELRDYDAPPAGYPYVSVWYKFTDISAASTGSWTTFGVTIADTSAAGLPPGWGGTGAETGVGEPILPPGRTFASVLAGVDEVAFTTFEPGFFFGFTAFDMRVDNIGVATTVVGAPVPALPEWGLIALVTCLLAAGAGQVRRRSMA